jgi:aspartokinase
MSEEFSKMGVENQSEEINIQEIFFKYLSYWKWFIISLIVCLGFAFDFMRTDKNAEPDTHYIKEKLAAVMKENEGYQVYITQGFICRNAYGEVDNLLRGGSDFTASLIGAALPAEEIQIWTDIDGMHNNDPRVVDKTEAIRQLNFEEAAELAYFGAKILHPTCVQPAKFAGIPVRLKNSSMLMPTPTAKFTRRDTPTTCTTCLCSRAPRYCEHSTEVPRLITSNTRKVSMII